MEHLSYLNEGYEWIVFSMLGPAYSPNARNIPNHHLGKDFLIDPNKTRVSYVTMAWRAQTPHWISSARDEQNVDGDKGERGFCCTTGKFGLRRVVGKRWRFAVGDDKLIAWTRRSSLRFSHPSLPLFLLRNQERHPQEGKRQRQTKGGWIWVSVCIKLVLSPPWPRCSFKTSNAPDRKLLQAIHEVTSFLDTAVTAKSLSLPFSPPLESVSRLVPIAE